MRSGIGGFRLALTAALLAGSAATLFAGENYALLVAVGDYDVEELRPLKYTRADILEFHRALIGSGYRPGNITLLHDDMERLIRNFRRQGERPRNSLPTASNIRRELKQLLGRLTAEDSVVVAFSGHGVQFQGEKKSYFCPSDSKLQSKDSLIAFEEVFQLLKESAAARKLFLVDACQNDPLSTLSKSRQSVDLESVTRPQTEPVPEGIIALFSCKAGQKSFESPELGHGIFFFHVLQGWRGLADVNGDGKLTYQEVAQHAEKQTSEFASKRLKVLQTPQLRAEFSGEWVLRKVGKPTPPPPVFDARKAKTAAETKSSQETWARYLKTTVETTNSIGMKLRLIPAGVYLRGSSAEDARMIAKYIRDEERYGNEMPQHTCRLTQPYFLGAHEVTRGEFARFVEATGYVTELEKDKRGGRGYNEQKEANEGVDRGPQYSWRNTGFSQTDRHPVVNVTHNDAVAFAGWLTQQEGLTYRLPTEAEWEFACRAGTTTHTYLSDDPEEIVKVANVGDAAAKKVFKRWRTVDSSDGFVFTAPVGSLLPNAFGLFDMHGNVFEVCSDWYDPKAYEQYANSEAVDPRGPDTGTERSYRSSGWRTIRGSSGSAHRMLPGAVMWETMLGFRVLAVPQIEY